MNLRTSFASLFLLLPLTAQQEAPPPPPAAPPAANAVAPGVTVTLAFPGGTLGDFVDQLRRIEPRANIVMAAGAELAKLPAMDLRGAGLDQALDSACTVAVSDRQIRIKAFRGPGEPVYTILVQDRAQRADGGREVVRTEVFGLARLTDVDPHGRQLSPTTVLSAIEAAVGDDRLDWLRYHQESGLMIVRGTGEELDVVQSVLKNLERDLQQRRNRVQPAAEHGERPAGAGGDAKPDKK